MLLPLVFAILVGLLLPTQAGVNSQLRTDLGHPVLAALASFVVGCVALVLLAVALRVPLPAGAVLSRAPWWHWTGGVLGALFVAATVVLAPRLGAAALTAALVAGQMLSSIVLDHFGWIGYPVQPVTVARVAGVVLVVAGVLLIQRP